MTDIGLQPRDQHPQARSSLAAYASEREEQAKREIGRTQMGRPVKWFLVALFVLTCGGVPLVQHVYDVRQYQAGLREDPLPQAYDVFGAVPDAAEAYREAEGGFFDKVFAGNVVLRREMRRYEDELEDQSLLGQFVRPPTQRLLAGLVGAGNEQVYIGRDGWLFYRPEIDYLTGPGFLSERRLKARAVEAEAWETPPQPDPRSAILQFNEQLAARGIRLILVPTPSKAMVHPEQFSAAYEGTDEVLQNLSYADFVAELERNGVTVFDAGPAMVDDKTQTGAPQFLLTDTHWRPEAMERAAGRLAGVIESLASSSPRRGGRALFQREEAEVTNLGDLATMLELPEGQTLYPPETVTIRPVVNERREPWRPDRAADVLLLGDSFTNIYSLGAMNWGDAAGFAEQLSFHLNRPVDVAARNDAGASATREILARELAAGRDRLAGKKVVVWQFAARELSVGDWKLLDMTVGEAKPSRFVVPEPGGRMVATGTIQSITSSPRPGSVPYEDHIVAMHLVDLEVDGEPVEGGEALVYVWGMRGREWTPAARYRAGQRVTVEMRPWSEVSDELGRINRADPADEALLFEEPNWGEVVE